MKLQNNFSKIGWTVSLEKNYYISPESLVANAILILD